MKKLLPIILCLALTGCATLKTEPPIVVKYKYIVSTVPEEFLSIPPSIYAIDPMKATDKELGIWLTDSERRSIEIEKKLKQIKSLRLKQLEDIKKLPPDDVIIR